MPQVVPMEVLDPVAEVTLPDVSLSPRLDTLRGKRVGILENAPARSLNLSRLPSLLRERMQVADVVVRRKPYTSRTAAREMIQELAQCDAVIASTAQ
ncbi:MAG: hypothetical protein HY684_07375 [Chloroflexi bacterium]|nr:hypothetical protein [Chloroflexota bacterium]